MSLFLFVDHTVITENLIIFVFIAEFQTVQAYGCRNPVYNKITQCTVSMHILAVHSHLRLWGIENGV